MAKSKLTKTYLVDMRDMLIVLLHDEWQMYGTDIAELFGLNQSTVSRILSDHHTTTIRQALRVLKKKVRK